MKKKQEEIEEAKKALIENYGIKPGTLIYTKLNHVSGSGMSRSISLLMVCEGRILDLTWVASRILGSKRDEKHGGIKVGGCGMDMGFHLVYSLGRRLFDKFSCTEKEDCPANDHTNAYCITKDGHCLICHKETGKSKLTRKSHYHDYPVCSKECQTKEWIHSDSGYALKHSWI